MALGFSRTGGILAVVTADAEDYSLFFLSFPELEVVGEIDFASFNLRSTYGVAGNDRGAVIYPSTIASLETTSFVLSNGNGDLLSVAAPSGAVAPLPSAHAACLSDVAACVQRGLMISADVTGRIAVWTTTPGDDPPDASPCAFRDMPWYRGAANLTGPHFKAMVQLG